MIAARLLAAERQRRRLMRQRVVHERGPVPLYPRVVERRYAAMLVELLDHVGAELDRVLVPRLPQFLAEVEALAPIRLDAWSDRLAGIMAQVRRVSQILASQTGEAI